jgi:hypothetical protein
MKPTEILHRVRERYSQCRSYSDSGIVEFDDVDQKRESIEFRTEFLSPDYLCFEWQDYGPRRGKSEHFSTLWSNGAKTIVRRDTSKVTVEEQPNLGLAIAGATGCSAGAAHIVPALLMEPLRTDCKHLLLLTHLKLLREEHLNEHNCYVLKGSLFKEDDHILWVSTSDFGLRRVRNDQSRTAEQSEREINAITENADLMARLKERGIAPPTEMKHTERRIVTEYIYNDIFFDNSIVRAPQPVAI